MTIDDIIQQRVIGADVFMRELIAAYDRHDKSRKRSETRIARQIALQERAKFLLKCEREVNPIPDMKQVVHVCGWLAVGLGVLVVVAQVWRWL